MPRHEKTCLLSLGSADSTFTLQKGTRTLKVLYSFKGICTFHPANNNGVYQPAQVHRLICAFVHRMQKESEIFSWPGSNVKDDASFNRRILYDSFLFGPFSLIFFRNCTVSTRVDNEMSQNAASH